MESLLVIEDEKELLNSISYAFSPMKVVGASTLTEARVALERRKFGLVLLDVALPDGDGLKFYAELTADPSLRNTPVIFMTGSEEVSDKVMAFTLGAEDYITKPFHLSELRARVEARMRKLHKNTSLPTKKRVGNLTIEPDSRRISLKEQQGRRVIPVTPNEYEILLHLAENRDRVVSREQLIHAVWGDTHVTDRTIDTHVSNLRRKIRASEYKIVTLYGSGYSLRKE